MNSETEKEIGTKKGTDQKGENGGGGTEEIGRFKEITGTIGIERQESWQAEIIGIEILIGTRTTGITGITGTIETIEIIRITEIWGTER